MTALGRGLRGRCPCCGQGRMFRAFLKVADKCDVCGEELFHHRADDFPPYLVMVVVGHIVVGMIWFVETNYTVSYWVEMAFFLPFTFLLALALLQPMKGLVVALQWSLGMHGFEDSKARHLSCGTRVAQIATKSSI
jgi:uncharacterized protein (DUF983 family)